MLLLGDWNEKSKDNKTNERQQQPKNQNNTNNYNNINNFDYLYQMMYGYNQPEEELNRSRGR